MNAIDLFAGCGGLSKGFMDAGFDIIVGVDNDQDTFKNKVIMYLFEDAAKQKRPRLFEGCFLNSSRYSEICREFEAKGVGIFNHDIQLDCEVEDVKYGDTTQE